MYVQVRMLKDAGSLDAVLAIEASHPQGVAEDQADEDVDRALLREPEAQREAREMEVVQGFDEDDAQTEGDGEPDAQQRADQAKIRSPVRRGASKWRCGSVYDRWDYRSEGQQWQGVSGY